MPWSVSLEREGRGRRTEREVRAVMALAWRYRVVREVREEMGEGIDARALVDRSSQRREERGREWRGDAGKERRREEEEERREGSRSMDVSLLYDRRRPDGSPYHTGERVRGRRGDSMREGSAG